MTQVIERLVTAEEFAEMPYPKSGGKLELVRGKVVEMPPAGPEHGEEAVHITVAMFGHADAHRLGKVRVETGYWLGSDPDHIRAPDVSFVSTGRLPGEAILHDAVTQVPDLAIEITSPFDRDSEVHQKVLDYLAAGIQRVWVVRPERKTVTVHRPDGNSHTYAGDDALSSKDAGFSVEGFTLPLRDIFRD